MKITNEKTKYKIIYVIVTIVMCLRCVGLKLSEALVSSLDITYESGFTDKGLIGSLYHLIVETIIGIETTDTTAFAFSAITMIIGVVVICILGIKIIDLLDDGNKKFFVFLITFIIFAASVITGEDYMGSPISWMLLITVIDSIIISLNKSKVLMVVLPILGIIVGSEYLFAFMGCIILLLIYNIYIKGKKDNMIVLILNIITTIGVYLYYVFAKETAPNFVDFPSIDVSILRIVVTIVLASPFIAFAIIIFRGVLKKVKTQSNINVWFYRLWMGLGVSVCPLFVISNNYGTWFFAIVSYYLLTTIMLIIMKDEIITEVIGDVIEVIRSKCKWLVFLLIYTILFTPIDNVKVCFFVDNFINW